MSEDRSQVSPSRRDRAIRRVRKLTWAVAAGTAGLATTLSVVAAHAFKGNTRRSGSASTPAAAPKHKARHRVVVPGPQHVPSIAPLTPPAAAPTPSPTPAPAPATPTPAPATPAPAPAPQPQTSGGS